MPKKGSPSLFELIKSLSQTEKRYFKVFLQKHVKGNRDTYERLFDFICRQKDYDETKLKSFQHLAVMKVRLEENILWSLHDFHSTKSITEKLKHEIRTIEILFQKSLFDHACRQISKSKIVARHYEDFLALYEILKWEIKIHNTRAFADISEEELKNIYKEADMCLEKIREANQYGMFSDSIYLRIRKSGFFRKKDDFRKFKRLANNQLLKSSAKALSVEANYYLHSAHIGLAELQGKYTIAHKHNREILKLIEANPQHMRKDPRKYLSMQQNLVVWQYQLKEYSSVLESLGKLKLFIIENRTLLSENLFARTLFYIHCIFLLTYARTGEYEIGIKAISSARKDFEKYKVKPMNKEMEWMFYDAAAGNYFGAGNFSESIRWYNKIINDRDAGVRSDMQCLARIVSLFAHYELGNVELLRYMVKWTYRFLKKRNRLYEFENIILDFISKKAFRMNTKKETNFAFNELKQKFEKLLPDKFQRRPLDDFEYIEWLESKIQSKSFAQIVREKNRI